MKAFILIALVMFTFTSFSQKLTKEDLKLVRKATGHDVRVEPDFFNNVFWVKCKPIQFMAALSSGSGKTESKVHEFYYGVTKDSANRFTVMPMRYSFTMKSGNWLFAERITVLVSETNNETREGIGNKYEINLDQGKPYREVKYNGIEESYDIKADDQVLGWAKEVGDKGYFSRMRIQGSKGYEEAVLRGKDMQDNVNAIFNSITAIKALNK